MVGKTITEQIIDEFIESLKGDELIDDSILTRLRKLFEKKRGVSKKEIITILESEVST